jgi:DNA invertase Pin-like site-specific DNA recombinase
MRFGDSRSSYSQASSWNKSRSKEDPVNPKITLEHQGRGAVVYVRQSTLAQVVDHAESRRRQYELADVAHSMGFVAVETIDEDLGRSGSGLVDRPGFQRLVSKICAGSVGAVFCIEASRLARNGRDWHHLIDLVATVVVDPDGVYDPRLVNDRLLLGLKGTMSEYELSLLRQRGLAARDAKASRGELRFSLPPGFCWNELGQITIDPDERVAEAIRTIFRKFRELGSARQVLLWAKDAAVELPVTHPSPQGTRVGWRTPAYHNIVLVLKNPLYAGAYAFGRTENRTQIIEGRARRTSGHKKPCERWSVLIRDHHEGYFSWAEYEDNQRMLSENAHMQKRMARKSGRGGRALLTGLIRCGVCGRMMHVFYGMRSGHAHRYLCRGDAAHGASVSCLAVGGIRADRAVSAELLNAVAPHAVDIALEAAVQVAQIDEERRKAHALALEAARYEASLAERRHAAVDPAKRLVARELEARWEAALGRVREMEVRLVELDAKATVRPRPNEEALHRLTLDLPKVWNAPSADGGLKQRIVRTLIHEVMVNRDDARNEVVLNIHWAGGRHTEVRVGRVRVGRYPADCHPSAVEVLRKLGGSWPDRDLAVTMNRMRCKSEGGRAWTVQRVRTLRERIGIPPFEPSQQKRRCISLAETARRLSICVEAVHRLVRRGILPATQRMPSAPWEVPEEVLDSEAVRIGVREIQAQRPRNLKKPQDNKTLRLPSL